MYFRGDLGHPLSRLEKCAWSKLAMGLGFHRWCLDAPWLFSQMICNLKTHGNPWKSLLPIFSCLWIHKWFISSPYHPISISLMRVSWDWTNWSSRDTNTTAGSAHFAMVRMWRFPGREQFVGVHRELGCWLLHHDSSCENYFPQSRSPDSEDFRGFPHGFPPWISKANLWAVVWESSRLARGFLHSPRPPWNPQNHPFQAWHSTIWRSIYLYIYI